MLVDLSLIRESEVPVVPIGGDRPLGEIEAVTWTQASGIDDGFGTMAGAVRITRSLVTTSAITSGPSASIGAWLGEPDVEVAAGGSLAVGTKVADSASEVPSPAGVHPSSRITTAASAAIRLMKRKVGGLDCGAAAVDAE